MLTWPFEARIKQIFLLFHLPAECVPILPKLLVFCYTHARTNTTHVSVLFSSLEKLHNWLILLPHSLTFFFHTQYQRRHNSRTFMTCVGRQRYVIKTNNGRKALCNNNLTNECKIFSMFKINHYIIVSRRCMQIYIRQVPLRKE